MKIALINVQSRWLKKKKDPRILPQLIPPLGLMYLSSYLKEKLKFKTFQLTLFSSQVDFDSLSELNEKLEIFEPDLVGLSSTLTFQEEFHEIANNVKSLIKKPLVIGGGPYSTLCFKEILKDKNIDFCVLSEGEKTFTSVIELLMNDEYKSIKNLAGIAYRKSKNRIDFNAPELIKDLDIIPFPDYSLINLDEYSKFLSYGYNLRKQGVLLTTRGCPGKCIFCSKSLGNILRLRSSENIFEEIKYLMSSYGIRDFYIIDDAFAFDKKVAEDIFDKIINSGVKINIYLVNGIKGDLLDHAFIDKMIKAGVIWVTFAIESASPRIQKYIKKNLNLKKLKDIIIYTSKKGIMINYTAMVGFPTETIDEAWMTLKFIEGLPAFIIPMYFLAKYYPGTELYNIAIKLGFTGEYIKNSWKTFYHNFETPCTVNINKNDLLRLNAYYLRKIFLNRNRIKKAIDIQERYYTKKEILATYSLLFNQYFESYDEIISKGV